MARIGRHARWAAAPIPVTFVAFDLLHLDGEDLCPLPLVERRVLLDGLGLVGPASATSGWYCDGDTLFAVCAEHGHEGVVAKRLDSPVPAWPALEDLAEGDVRSGPGIMLLGVGPEYRGSRCSGFVDAKLTVRPGNRRRTAFVEQTG